MPTGAFIVSPVITSTAKTLKRCFLDFDTLLLDATFDVGAIIGACVIEGEALIKGVRRGIITIGVGVDAVLPPSQSFTSCQVPFFSAHPHLSPRLASDPLMRDRRKKESTEVFMLPRLRCEALWTHRLGIWRWFDAGWEEVASIEFINYFPWVSIFASISILASTRG